MNFKCQIHVNRIYGYNLFCLFFLQEHVTEYGVHWNFFFTLGFLPIFVTLCRILQKYTRFSIVGLIISIRKRLFFSFFVDVFAFLTLNLQLFLCLFFAVYQVTLLKFGLEDYIQHAPRTNIISANKEGITSFFGTSETFFVFFLDLRLYF